ncbi:MAG: transposase [Candidatus Thiodiazotropha sp. (ex Lucinoma kastoroae)]|nr:transposase [Candidatus Thiodiazotropha sp. (ex Lucinoma kastoroae)]
MAVQRADFSLEKVLVQNEELRCSLEAKDHQIKLLEEQINHLLHHRFGSKSERFNERRQWLFENEEATCEGESTPEIEVPAHTRKTGGRRNPPKNRPRVRVEHDLTEEEKQCTCGHCLTLIGEETSFQYDVVPAKFQVLNEAGRTAQQKSCICTPVRRQFDAASKASSPGAANIARQGLKLIRDLYHLDNQGKERPPDESRRYRQEAVKPHLDEIRAWIIEKQGRALSYGGCWQPHSLTYTTSGQSSSSSWKMLV